MSRERLGGWGATLSRPDLADALAAYGTIGDEQLGFHAQRPDAELGWLAPHDPAPPPGDAAAYRDAWNRCLDEHRREHGPEARVRLAVRGVPRGLPARWLFATLASASGVSAVHLVEPEGSSVAWDWPLDVAILEDGRSRRLGAALGHPPYERFVRIVRPHAATDQIDLLLVPGGVVSAADLVTRRRPAAPVHTVVALGPVTGRDPIAALRGLRNAARAAAAAVCPISPASARTWLLDLARELAHDRTLDEALFDATRARGPNFPLLLAEPGALGRARVAVAAMAVGKRLLRAAPKAARARLPSGESEAMGVPARASVEEVATAMAERPQAFDWRNEDRAASAVATMAGAEPAVPAEARTTYLQAQVLERTGAGFEPVVDRPLASARDHRIDVVIGRPREGFARPGASFPAPQARPEGHVLTVMLTDPVLAPEPRFERIVLGADGESDVCSFHVSTGAEARRLDARVTVLHENRVLQTVRLRAGIAGRGDERGLRITLESVVHARLGELGGTPGFDAALVLNEDDGHEPRLTLFRGGRGAFVSLAQVQEVVDGLRGSLDAVADDPQSYGGPRAAKLEQLLVELAGQGRELYDGLLQLPRVGEVFGARAPERLQVVSQAPEDFLPLELCYDLEAPDVNGASLCNRWRNALAAGACGTCTGRSSKVVCPLGFWGLRIVVERQTYDPDRSREVQDHAANFALGPSEAIAGRPPLRPFRSLVRAHTQKAPDEDPGFLAAMKRIDGVVKKGKGRAAAAKDWDDWAKKVRRGDPSLLLLVTHVDVVSKQTALELAKKKFLGVSAVKAEYVHVPAVVPPDPGPVVLLLGCRTGGPVTPMTRAATRFRAGGASVVLATFASIHALFVGALAERLVAAFAAAGRGQPRALGEAVAKVRRELLRAGNPIGLCLVAYGDADWRLGEAA